MTNFSDSDEGKKLIALWFDSNINMERGESFESHIQMLVDEVFLAGKESGRAECEKENQKKARLSLLDEIEEAWNKLENSNDLTPEAWDFSTWERTLQDLRSKIEGDKNV